MEGVLAGFGQLVAYPVERLQARAVRCELLDLRQQRLDPVVGTPPLVAVALPGRARRRVRPGTAAVAAAHGIEPEISERELGMLKWVEVNASFTLFLF